MSISDFFKKKTSGSAAPVRDAIEEELARFEQTRERQSEVAGPARYSPDLFGAHDDRLPGASSGKDLILADALRDGALTPWAGTGTSLAASHIATGNEPEELKVGVDPKVLKLLTPQFAHELAALPVRIEGDTALLAVSESPDIHRHHMLLWIVNSASERRRNVRFTIISKELLHHCLDIYYPWSSNVQLIPPANDLVRLFLTQASQSNQQVLRADDLKGVLSVRSLVKGIMIKAVHRGAADVCFEPDRTEFRIRFKVEGECELACTALPPNAGPLILSIIKQWAGVDIAERERTQDGKFAFTIEIRPDHFVEYRFRVAITPTIHGEECTIRLLENSSNRKRLDSLKADPRTLDHLWRVVNTRRGFILLTGKTGSGKTTTLAAILSECDAAKERIITIEDPVEIPLDGIAQTQVNEKKGETFERLLRNALRRAPDRILIGEIRDNETAHYALKGALTGHQVLSTVHADYAVQVVARLLMEGVSPFNLASTLTLVVAQRLMNLLCEHCAVPVTYDAETLLREQFTESELGDIQAREGRGCALCNNKGTNGRMAIYETMVITDELKAIINSNRPDLESALDLAAVRGGMRPLRRCGLDLVKRGRISLTQVIELCRPMRDDVYDIVRDTVSQSVAIEDFGFDPNSTGDWGHVRPPALLGSESEGPAEVVGDDRRALPPAADGAVEAESSPSPVHPPTAEITERVDWIRAIDDDEEAEAPERTPFEPAVNREPWELTWPTETSEQPETSWQPTFDAGSLQAPPLGAAALRAIVHAETWASSAHPVAAHDDPSAGLDVDASPEPPRTPTGPVSYEAIQTAIERAQREVGHSPSPQTDTAPPRRLRL